MSYKAYVEINKMDKWQYYNLVDFDKNLEIVNCRKKVLKSILPKHTYQKLSQFFTGKKTFIWFDLKELLQIPNTMSFKRTMKIFRPKLVEEIKKTHKLLQNIQEELAEIANNNFVKSEDIRFVLEHHT